MCIIIRNSVKEMYSNFISSNNFKCRLVNIYCNYKKLIRTFKDHHDLISARVKLL